MTHKLTQDHDSTSIWSNTMLTVQTDRQTEVPLSPASSFWIRLLFVLLRQTWRTCYTPGAANSARPQWHEVWRCVIAGLPVTQTTVEEPYLLLCVRWNCRLISRWELSDVDIRVYALLLAASCCSCDHSESWPLSHASCVCEPPALVLLRVLRVLLDVNSRTVL